MKCVLYLFSSFFIILQPQTIVSLFAIAIFRVCLIILNVGSKKGINAMTISDLTGIPRPTVIRKLKILFWYRF